VGTFQTVGTLGTLGTSERQGAYDVIMPSGYESSLEVFLMPRHDTFTFRVNHKEGEMLEKLAERLQRSRSDAVRLLIREAVAQLDPQHESQAPAVMEESDGHR
jgi:hypothetical protein